MSLAVFPSNVRGLAYPVEKISEFNTIVQSAPNLLETTVAQTRNPCWEWQFIYEFLYDDAEHLLSGYSDYRVMQGFVLAMSGRAGEFLYTDPTDNAVGPALISGTPNPLAALQLIDDGVGNYYSPVQRNFGGQFFEDITDLNGAIAVYENGTHVTAGPNSLGGSYQMVGPGLALPGSSFMGLVIAWNAPFAGYVPGHVYATNDEILDPVGHIQKATTGGTAGSVVPVFDETVGGTTPDGPNTLVWANQGYNPGPTGPINAEFSFYFRAKFGGDKQDFTQFMNGLWTIGGSESSSGGTFNIKSSRPVQV